MKILNLSIVCVTLAILMSSCFSIHQGNMSSNVIESNMTYKQTVKGEAKSTIVFGFGGANKSALVQDAKRNMEVSRFLKPNERYINYTIDRKDSYYFGLVLVQKLTVHADIVAINQEIDDPMSKEFRENYFTLRPTNKSLASTYLFSENDNVLLADGSNANVFSLYRGNVIVYKLKEGAYIKEELFMYDIFSKSVSSYKSLHLGDRVDISEEVGKPKTFGEIVGFSQFHVLVKYDDDKFTIKRY